jgi:hypothetical protein
MSKEADPKELEEFSVNLMKAFKEHLVEYNRQANIADPGQRHQSLDGNSPEGERDEGKRTYQRTGSDPEKGSSS